MARTYKQLSIVSGMTVDDILKMDEKTFDALSLSDLRKITGRLVSAGNRRLRAWEKREISTPATRSVDESGGAFSIAGKTKSGVVSEFMRVKKFMNRKTSTMKGFQEWQQNIETTLTKKNVPLEISENDKKGYLEAFKAFNRLRKNSSKAKTISSDTLLKEIQQYRKEHPRRGWKRVATDLYKELNSIYEKQQEINNDSGTDKFFNVEQDNDG